MLIPYPHQPVHFLFLKGKNQAFIELEDIQTATHFIQFYQHQPLRIR